MSEYAIIQKENLTAIGDAIREYTGENKLYTLDEMEEMLESQVAKLISGDSIKTFVIPDGVEYISQYAFYDCKSLTSVVIPNSVTSIGSSAFSGCSSLSSISIPDSVKNIYGQAFIGCSSLSSISISDNTTINGPQVFEGTAYYNNPLNWENGALCINNRLVHTKSTDDLIGSYKIKQGIVRIDNYAFDSQYALTSVTIPNSVTMIGSRAFYRCSTIATINVPWSEGEVEGAPWGATNATINYNYTGEVV